VILPSVKVLIGAVTAAIVLGAAGVTAYFAFFDGPKPRYETQAALRSALPVMAAAELQARGHPLSGPLTCTDLPGWNKHKLRVRCSGTTAARKPVQVIGAVEHAAAREYFTILIDGRPLVQNAPCLGADCRAGG